MEKLSEIKPLTKPIEVENLQHRKTKNFSIPKTNKVLAFLSAQNFPNFFPSEFCVQRIENESISGHKSMKV